MKNTILKMIDAGFTKAEIMMLLGGAEKKQEPEKKAAEPEPEKKAAESEPEKNLPLNFAEILREELKTAMQNANLLNSSINNIQSDEETEMNVLAKIINPYGDETEG